MANVMIAGPNRIDAATLLGGAWETENPLENLQTRDYGEAAISVDRSPSSTTIIIDHGEAVENRVVALLFSPPVRRTRAQFMPAHPLTADALWRVSHGTTPGGAEEDTTGWLDCWQTDYTRERRADPVVVLPAGVSARYTTIEIDDETTTLSFLRLPRIFVGPAFQPTYDAEAGLEDGLTDRSSIQELEGGGLTALVRRKLRRVAFELNFLSHAQEFPELRALMQDVGTHDEVYWLPDPDDPEVCQRDGFVGTLARLNGFRHPYAGTRSIGIEIREDC